MAADTLSPAALEDARFSTLREFSYRLGLFSALMPPLALLRDLLNHPEWVQATLIPRSVVILVMLSFPLALRLGAGRAVLPWLLYGSSCVVVSLLVVALPAGGFPAGYIDSNWVILYLFLLAPLLGLPFPLRTNLAGLAALLTVPMVLSLCLPLPGFSLRRFYLMVWPAALIMGYVHVLIGRMTEAGLRSRLEIERLALTDALTGLSNRRHFMAAATLALKQAHRVARPACLLVLDIDHFKRVNDTHGHATGDQVIRATGQGLRDSLRETDLAARIGGEEFAAFLPDSDTAAGLVAAERVRAHLESLRVAAAGPTAPLAFTVSIGVASLREGDTLDPLLERADRGLYAAKQSGRNRVATVESLSSGHA